MQTLDPRQLDQLARRRAKAKLGFFAHGTVYVVINLGLIALSFASGRAWALFPLLGWGLGLLMHGLAVFLLAPGSNLLEGMVQRERARLGDARGEPW